MNSKHKALKWKRFSKSPAWVFIACIVFLLSGVFIGRFVNRNQAYLAVLKKNSSQPPVNVKNLDNQIESAEEKISITQAVTSIPTEQNKTSILKGPVLCKSSSLGLEMRIPLSWTCQIEDMPDKMGYISLKKDKIVFNVSNLGRGGAPDCSRVTDTFSTTPQSCSDTVFHSNDTITARFYKTDINAEIFGTFRPQKDQIGKSSTYISITYPDMLTTDLPANIIYEIFEILDSIRFVHQ